LVTTSLAVSAMAGCFKAAEDDGLADEIGTDTGTGESGTDTTETTTTESDDEPLAVPPTIDVFTVDGSEMPDAIASASAIEIVVEASDADGEIVEVEILRNGVVLATIPAPGPYTAEWVIGGEAFDGVHEFTARAVDDDGLDTTADPITLTVDVPNGGMVDEWPFDGGEDDLVYRVWTDEEGSEVLAGGLSYLAGTPTLKIDRLVGPTWVGASANPQPASGVVGLPNGDFVATSWDGINKSVRLRYNTNGTQLDEEIIDWTPANVPPESFEAPLDLAVDSEGSVYATGIFATGQNFDTFMLRKFADDGTSVWNVYGSNPMTYPVPPYAVRIDVSGDTVAISGQLRGAPEPPTARMWMGRYGTNGGLIDQLEIPDFAGMAWAVGIGDQGDIMLGGARYDMGLDMNKAWVARYDDELNQVWVKDEDHPGIGATIAAHIDPWGDSVVVQVIECEGGLPATVGCDLRIRKYDPEGTLVWEHLIDDDTFQGPQLLPIGGDLHFDRYGYIYLAVTRAGLMMNLDWWVSKFNP
jgi:hypothetical protein